MAIAAEKASAQFETLKGAAVALDVRTGEVLALASKPDYDLNEFSPRLSTASARDIHDREAWTDLAIAGVYHPGSTFKLVVAIAGLRDGGFQGYVAYEMCSPMRGGPDQRNLDQYATRFLEFMHGMAGTPLQRREAHETSSLSTPE